MRQVMDQFHASFWVYQDSGSAGNHFFEWMKFPDAEAAVGISGSWTETKYSGATAIRCTFRNLNGRNYGGFLFQNGILRGDDKAPKENFGTEANAGLNLTGATQLSFWARGESGGEVVRFFMGGIGWDTTGFLRRPQTPCTKKVEGPCPYPDSTPKAMIQSVLTREWRRYVINLRGRDLHYVLGGFGWYADAVSNPEGAVFYVDDIQYELDDSARNKRLQQPRFLLSYQTESDPQDQSIVGRFDLAQRNTAYTYDNALALLAFLADGTPDSIRRARLIGDAFVWASRHDRTFTDGRLRSAYQAGDVDLPPGWLPHDRPGTARVPGFYNEAPDFHLSPGEIIDLPALARQLLAGDGPDLKRIRPGLSDETVKMLAKYAVYPATVLPDCSCWSLNKPKMSSAENLKPLIRDLNLLIDKSILRPPDAPAKGAPALQLSQRLAWARDNRAALDKLFPQELLASQSFIEVRQEAIDSGDNAWTMIALLALYQASHDAQYLETAKRIGEFLGKFKDGSEGYQGFLGGIDSPEKKSSAKTQPQNGPAENEPRENDKCPRSWASTEHNLDVYAAFTRMFQITADDRWRDGAAHARRFVEAMWDDDPQGGAQNYHVDLVSLLRLRFEGCQEERMMQYCRGVIALFVCWTLLAEGNAGTNPIRYSAQKAFEAAAASPFDGNKQAEWLASLPKDHEFYVIEGDLLMTNEEALAYLVTKSSPPTSVKSAELLVNRIGGQDDFYSGMASRELSYFIEPDGFTPPELSKVTTALQTAMSDWSNACGECGISFIRAASPGNVNFKVRRWDVHGAYIAASFFPHDSNERAT
jgi:hypothetical protein